jgi:beta-N-acetylhexosaminidase
MMGRLVFTGFFGTTMTDDTRRLLRDVGVGGLIVYSENVSSRSQLLSLSRSIRKAAGRPVFVSVTQEPGVVDHLNGIFPDLPSPPELARKDPMASRRAGCTMGQQLRSVGLDVNFAPVLDVIGQQGAFIGTVRTAPTRTWWRGTAPRSFAGSSKPECSRS